MAEAIFDDICAVSIHAPARRATYLLEENIESTYGFNPRPREEGDLRFCPSTTKA